MDHPARLPIDCPRCENRGVIDLDDDATLPCPLCNSWCMLCLADVPTFVPIARPYRGSLIAGMRPTADGRTLCGWPIVPRGAGARLCRALRVWAGGELATS